MYFKALTAMLVTVLRSPFPEDQSVPVHVSAGALWFRDEGEVLWDPVLIERLKLSSLLGKKMTLSSQEISLYWALTAHP